MSLSSALSLGYTTDEVYERTTVILRVEFLDDDSNLVKPDTATYVVYDKFSGELRGEGTIQNTQTSIYLELTPDVNIMYNDNNEYEYAVVQVTYTYGSNKTGISTTEYKITNLLYSFSSSSSSSAN